MGFWARQHKPSKENVSWYRENMPHILRAKAEEGGTQTDKNENTYNLGFKGDHIKLFLRGPQSFLNRLEFEADPDEAILRILRQVSKADEVDVVVAVNLRNIYGSDDPLYSDDDDAEGDATNVGNLHYCSCCGKDDDSVQNSEKCDLCQKHEAVHL